MKAKNQKLIIYGSLTAFLFLAIRKLVNKRKMVTIKGFFVVPADIPNRADALHSFQSRRSDGFGGKMSTKINEALRKMYRYGTNPDIYGIKINVDSKKYRVDWEATLGPSKDGKAYVGISTAGSTGANANERAKAQIAALKTWVSDGGDYTLVLDFVNPKSKGNYIRQFFYKYTKASYPPNN